MLSSLDGWFAPAPDPARVAWLRGVTYAHRGMHGGARVENSRSAFAAAAEAGLGIECDVQESADGRAVVFHDWELDRLTAERGPVAGRGVAELARIALRGSDDTIPILPELLELVAGRVPLLIELKTRRERPVAALCDAVLHDLEGYRGPHAVMGFDPRVVHWFATTAPHIARGLVVSEAEARTWRGAVRRRLSLWRARPEFLAYDVRDLPSAFAAAQRARGLPVLTWTVASAALREKGATHADGWIAEREGLAIAPAAA